MPYLQDVMLGKQQKAEMEREEEAEEKECKMLTRNDRPDFPNKGVHNIIVLNTGCFNNNTYLYHALTYSLLLK